jgi:hypothetical protein
LTVGPSFFRRSGTCAAPSEQLGAAATTRSTVRRARWLSAARSTAAGCRCWARPRTPRSAARRTARSSTRRTSRTGWCSPRTGGWGRTRSAHAGPTGSRRPVARWRRRAPPAAAAGAVEPADDPVAQGAPSAQRHFVLGEPAAPVHDAERPQPAAGSGQDPGPGPRQRELAERSGHDAARPWPSVAPCPRCVPGRVPVCSPGRLACRRGPDGTRGHAVPRSSPDCPPRPPPH